MILGCVQPSYLPWIPFFKRMQMSDVFVYLDDVEFSKNSFHNRNRIKSASGPLMLTVPVLHKGHSKDHICDIKINPSANWAKAHWRAIEMNYSKARYFGGLAPLLEKIYAQSWEKLGDLNVALIELFKNYLGLRVSTHRSSELSIPGEGNEKLVRMCQKLGADKFIVKPNTEGYHPKSFFESRGISLEYLSYENKEYEQLYGEFVPDLSVLDYAMNCGPDSLV
jgi:hypothetical protein